MVRSVKGGVLLWLLFLALVSLPAYFAYVNVRKFFSDKPLQARDTEAERLRKARMEEFARRNPEPRPAPPESFQDQEEKEQEPVKPADEFADLRGLNDVQRRNMTKEHLFLIRGALYQYKREQGKCPARLEDLVPDYLLDMPPALVPGPLGTITKNVYNASNGAIPVDGSGGWSYNADPKHPDYCAVRPNSTVYTSSEGAWKD